MALIDDQKTLGGEPVVTLAIGGHTLTAFVIGYEYEERAQRAGGLRIWLDNRGDEFDDLAVGYPGLVRGAAVDLRRGLGATTVKLPRTWVDGLRYVFVEGTAMLWLDCIDWWDRLDRYRYATGQLWTNTEVRTIVSAILGDVGLTIAAGDFGVQINFGVSVRRGCGEAVRDAMSRVEEYLYTGLDGDIQHKQLDPAEASGYTYDWSAGGGANHPLMKGTEISEQSPRFNKIMVVGGGNWEYSGMVEDAGEQALVGVRMRTLSDRYLSSDVECTERAQAELRYWQAQELSGTVVARPHFTLSLYDMVTVGAPAWGGPALTGRVMVYSEEYGRLRGVWEQRIIIGEVPYLAMGSSGLGYGSVVGEHIDPETGLIVAAYKIRMEGEIVVAMYAQVEEDVGTSATHETIGYGAAEPEGLIEFIAKTYDGGAHGGVATVTMTMDTETGKIEVGGAERFAFQTAYQEMAEQAADPAAPGLNRARVYLRDDGGGNTQLCVRFSTGDIVVLATQGLTLETTFLELDCTNDPLTAGLEINAATTDEPVLTLLTTDDNITNPYLDLNNSGTPMSYIMEKDGTRFLHTYGTDCLYIGPAAGNFTETGDGRNVGIGPRALGALTTGAWNVGIGVDALGACTEGLYNVALGPIAAASLTTGQHNFALGEYALWSVTSGITNVAIGTEALRANTGDNNVAIGAGASKLQTTGSMNVSIGTWSLLSLLTGQENMAIGMESMRDSLGSYNVAIGARAGRSLTTGNENILIGGWTGFGVAGVSSYGFNVIIGTASALGLTSGSNNTLLGWHVGFALTSGSDNVMLGYAAGSTLTTESDRLIIANTSTLTPLVYGEFDTYRVAFGNEYAVDKYGQLAHGSGQFAAAGDAQGTVQFCLRRSVTHSDDSWYELFLDGAAERLTLAADSVWTFEALIVGATQGCAKALGFRIVGSIENDGGVTTLLDYSVETVYDEHELGWSVRASGDDANDALLIEVQNFESSGDVVRWVATVRTAEVSYPS